MSGVGDVGGDVQGLMSCCEGEGREPSVTCSLSYGVVCSGVLKCGDLRCHSVTCDVWIDEACVRNCLFCTIAASVSFGIIFLNLLVVYLGQRGKDKSSRKIIQEAVS